MDEIYKDRYHISLNQYVLLSNELLNKLCKVLELKRSNHLFYDYIDNQNKINEIAIDKIWLCRIHGIHIAFINSICTVHVNIENPKIIEKSFYEQYLKMILKNTTKKLKH